MLHRMIPALSLLAIAGCQPYYGYSQYNMANPASPYGGRTLVNPGNGNPGNGPYVYKPPQPTYAAAGNTMPRIPGVTGFAVAPVALLGGSFHDIDLHAGEVSFWNDDPVKKREVANYPGRYVERLTLKSGAVFVYEALSGGDMAGPSDGDQIRVDLDAAGFRDRGITFDAAELAHTGPFTYLAQSSSTDNCFVFRTRFRHPGSQVNQRAYGNLCASKATADLAAVRTEMLYVLNRVRFANGVGDNLLTAAAAPAAAAIAPAAAPAVVAAGEHGPITMSLDQCGYDVKFSRMPALGEAAGSEYSYENAAYSERASCSCRKDLDYSKVSEFDAVDNTRARVEKKGFKFEKATFDETPGLGKELAYEAVVERDGTQTFLVGRTFYRQCSFTVETTGASYGDLLKGRKFVESVEARAELAAPTPLVSDAVIGHATVGSTAAPAAAPRVPVGKADLSTAADKKAVDETPVKPAAAATSAAVAAPIESPVKPAVAATSATVAVPAENPVKPAAVTTSAAAPTPAETAAAIEPVSSDATATRLRRLKTLLDQKLITPGEYDAKRKLILDDL
jgi:hypothetical protein